MLKIAFRNILRNRRRSAMTGSAIAVGAVAMLLFGGFISFIFAGLETGMVRSGGHLTVFRSGYFLFGAGNPSAYGIPDYQAVMTLIRQDPVLKPLIGVVTPTQQVVGIAGNFAGGADAAKTFFGQGLVPSDQQRMLGWNEYDLPRNDGASLLADDQPQRGVVGQGLARMLALCGPLKVPDCPAPPATAAPAGPTDSDLADLARQALGGSAPTEPERPRLDLLGATAGGAPNVVSMEVAGVQRQGVKELDNSFVAMPLALAQQLVYGRGEHKVTGIVLQLHRTEDLPAARVRLAGLIADRKLDLEVRDFRELNPFYNQVVGLFGTIFLFITVIMGVIVLFAVVNTMTMNVLERTNEIGTIRAMGVRRSGIRRQFLLEGWLLGAVGATAGLVLALLIGWAVNHAGLTWTPPGNAAAVPLRLMTPPGPALLIGSWLGLVVIATVAALLPANRAARLPVVDALRHV
jgi:putative ABC transport system permease protein